MSGVLFQIPLWHRQATLDVLERGTKSSLHLCPGGTNTLCIRPTAKLVSMGKKGSKKIQSLTRHFFPGPELPTALRTLNRNNTNIKEGQFSSLCRFNHHYIITSYIYYLYYINHIIYFLYIYNITIIIFVQHTMSSLYHPITHLFGRLMFGAEV